MMIPTFLIWAAIFGGLGVGAGAFASHALKTQLTDKALDIFETGVRYQMYHALALLVIALLLTQFETPPPALVTAGIAFIAGVIIFSGSLYALSLTGIKILGAVTPLGGVAFLVGWIALGVAGATLWQTH